MLHPLKFSFLLIAVQAGSLLADGGSAIKLNVSGERKALVIDLINKSDSAIRIWKPGSSWGDKQFTLVHQDSHGSHNISARSIVYTVNFPVAVTVNPTDSYRFRFDLEDGTWDDVDGKLKYLFFSPGITSEAISEGVFLDRSKVTLGED